MVGGFVVVVLFCFFLKLAKKKSSFRFGVLKFLCYWERGFGFSFSWAESVPVFLLTESAVKGNIYKNEVLYLNFHLFLNSSIRIFWQDGRVLSNLVATLSWQGTTDKLLRVSDFVTSYITGLVLSETDTENYWLLPVFDENSRHWKLLVMLACVHAFIFTM